MAAALRLGVYFSCVRLWSFPGLRHKTWSRVWWSCQPVATLRVGRWCCGILRHSQSRKEKGRSVATLILTLLPLAVYIRQGPAYSPNDRFTEWMILLWRLLKIGVASRKKGTERWMETISIKMELGDKRHMENYFEPKAGDRGFKI